MFTEWGCTCVNSSLILCGGGSDCPSNLKIMAF